MFVASFCEGRGCHEDIIKALNSVDTNNNCTGGPNITKTEDILAIRMQPAKLGQSVSINVRGAGARA